MAWVTLGYSHWDYWLLYHKITVDYINRLVFVNDDVTSFDIKVDLYSALKELWLLEAPTYKYRNFQPPVRVIGGDDTVAGQTAGDIYFMQGGWRVVYDPTKVSVAGVLFSDDFDTAWLFSDDITQKIYPALVSSLVTGVDIEAVTAPSAETVADAVRVELTPELDNMDITVSSRSTQTSVDTVQTSVNSVQTSVEGVQTSVDAVQTTVDSIETKVDIIVVTLGNMSAVIDDLIKYQRNKSIIDATAFTLTIFDDDGTTPLTIFDLTDAAGVASITSIFRRIPR